MANTSLTSIEQALPKLLARLPVITEEQEVKLELAVGRVLARAVTAQVDVPAADCSAMDGYAVRAGGLAAGTVLPVSQRIAAGRAGVPLQVGTAARIFTGAPIPAGADAVVMQENVLVEGQRIRLLQAPVGGENVRFRGEDVAQRASLFPSGHRLRVQDVNLLAATGHDRVIVTRPLRVALLTTGDELVRPGRSLQPGQIYNSNHYALSVLLTRLGMEVVDLGVVADDLPATGAALQRAATLADCVVSSGGVSVGEEDHVKAAVQQLGRLEIWKLAIKPGKPFAFGEVAGKPFFGLPGNPVSAFVTFVLLVRPALLTMSGAAVTHYRALRLPAAFAGGAGDRQEYLRVSVVRDDSGSQSLIPYNSQSSGVSASLSAADGLAVIPRHTDVQVGDLLDYLPFAELVD